MTDQNIIDSNAIDEVQLDRLCNTILSKKVIPILGFDLLKYGQKEQVTDILKEIAEEYDKGVADKILKINPNMDGYDLLNAIYHSLRNDEERQLGFKTAISEKIVNARSRLNIIPQSMRLLAKIKAFKFYINATFFNIIEPSLSTFKVKKSEDPLSPSYDVVNYKHSELKDIKYNVAKRTNFPLDKFEKPTIYNMLGVHDDKDHEFVLTDIDYMELLFDMLTNEAKMFSNLYAAMNDASLLFIGCNFPDWILRFFLRFCFGDRMGKTKKVNYLIEHIIDEPSKAFFIDSFEIKKYKVRPDIFIESLYKNLRKKHGDNIEESINHNRVFISYNHEDKVIADKIKQQLEDNFVDVWFDEKYLESGDVIDDEIRDAIVDACVFIPIISNNIFNEIDRRKYFINEWDYAVSKKKILFHVQTKDYVFNRLKADSKKFDKETIESILKEDSEKKKELEKVDSPDYKLSEDFIKKLKTLQFGSRITNK